MVIFAVSWFKMLRLVWIPKQTENSSYSCTIHVFRWNSFQQYSEFTVTKFYFCTKSLTQCTPMLNLFQKVKLLTLYLQVSTCHSSLFIYLCHTTVFPRCPPSSPGLSQISTVHSPDGFSPQLCTVINIKSMSSELSSGSRLVNSSDLEKATNHSG